MNLKSKKTNWKEKDFFFVIKPHMSFYKKNDLFSKENWYSFLTRNKFNPETNTFNFFSVKWVDCNFSLKLHPLMLTLDKEILEEEINVLINKNKSYTIEEFYQEFSKIIEYRSLSANTEVSKIWFCVQYKSKWLNQKTNEKSEFELRIFVDKDGIKLQNQVWIKRNNEIYYDEWSKLANFESKSFFYYVDIKGFVLHEKLKNTIKDLIEKDFFDYD